jgi:hypothetical protein
MHPSGLGVFLMERKGEFGFFDFLLVPKGLKNSQYGFQDFPNNATLFIPTKVNIGNVSIS